MNLLATIVATAVWCGYPSVGYVRGDYNTMSSTAKEVDQCRVDILKCLSTHPHDEMCFVNEKLEKAQK